MNHAGPQHPVYAIQARGLGRREPLPTSFEELAADYAYADQIQKIQPEGPYLVLGWSARRRADRPRPRLRRSSTPTR
ncbi:thioesterase domain-containing protein [Streptomyces sp. NPDC047718]|uniref:thioesterase domain-containing protein n=1 Tax=Streptomyces sp. NPDC047718 TaxID=3155479 RepID=UPI0033D38844